MTRACLLQIRGRVQGVGFRAAARDAALDLGLSGWVRNLPDGAVEACAEGPDEAVEAFIAWCRRGPEYARVAAVEVTDVAAGGLSRFEVRRS